MLGKTKGRGRRGRQRMRWLDGIIIIPGTVHIPGIKARKGKETTGEETLPLLDHAQLLAFRL